MSRDLTSLSAASIIQSPEYFELKRRIIETTGMVYYADKDADLAERIRRRMETLGVLECKTYLNRLVEGAAGVVEFDALIAELTIGETYFFRHREQFDSLREVIIPDLIKRNQHTRRLRIWCAGCSIGAEPYSVAILLKRDFPELSAGWDIEVLGTDINRKFLELANEGRFDEWAFRSTAPELRVDYFTAFEGKRWRIDQSLKSWVHFQYHNLLRHPFPSLINNLAALDLIICRNVMIYFDRATYEKITLNFEESLVDGGWLILGHAEQTPGGLPGMTTVQLPAVTLYQKAKASAAALTSPFEFRNPVATSASKPAANAYLPGFVPVVIPPAPPMSVSLAPSKSFPDLNAIRAMADRGEFQAALDGCEASLQVKNSDPVIYFYEALVLEQLGRHAESENALLRAVSLDPAYVLAHYYLGMLYRRQKKSTQARSHFLRSLELLEEVDGGRAFDEADGITARELRMMVESNLVIDGG